MRFINRIDDCFKKNNLEEAISTVEFWEAEAIRLGDTAGLLSVLNEELGLFRRLKDKDKAFKAASLTIDILDKEDTSKSLSRATIFINLATTLSAFGEMTAAIEYYEKAQQIYVLNESTDTYEYASLLNNKSSALSAFGKHREAETCLKYAIHILEKEGNHDVDIALSYISLAHLYYDRDEKSVEQIEEFLDTAWNYINSQRQTRDEKYAFGISKCAPSFRYFKREIEAMALEETAKEIYGGNV